MSWHAWLAFVAASAVMGVIPGPGVTSIVGYALSSGRRTALASVAGLVIGNVVAMSVSLAGAGALLAASALGFSLLKWAGSIYLIGLGLVSLWKSRGATVQGDTPPMSPRTAFLGNVAVATFHPKTIVFYVAFAPQFISSGAAYAPQAAILIATFCAVVAVTDTAYALAASQASGLFKTPRFACWARRAGGGALIAAGLATAAVRR